MLLLRHFSALQRAEIAEMAVSNAAPATPSDFSALQRAEIAETSGRIKGCISTAISVLFNEPKLLKLRGMIETQ